jgi:LAO/AO transport system kinase
VKTISTEGTGIQELAEAIAKHKNYLHQTGDWAARDRARLRSEVEAVLQEELMDRFMQSISQTEYEDALEKIIQRHASPDEVVRSLLDGAQNLNRG